MPTTKYQRIFTKPTKTKGADKVLKSEYVTSISDATAAVISSKKLMTFKSEKDYLLLLSNSDNITVYSNDIPYILNKGNYTVLCRVSEFSAFSSSSTEAELYIIRFSSQTVQVNYFVNMVFSSNKEQLLILKKILTDIASCKHFKSDIKNETANDIVSEIITTSLNQFFLEGKRLVFYDQNIPSGYLNAEFRNSWERYNARNRHYIEISNNAVYYSKKSNHSRESEEAEKIADFINRNYMSNVTLEDIVKEFNFSKTYICRIFKSNFSKTILEYQNNLKMQTAKELLLKHEYTITQISDMMNYSSIHYFSACFKNYYGISPRAFLLDKEL